MSSDQSEENDKNTALPSKHIIIRTYKKVKELGERLDELTERLKKHGIAIIILAFFAFGSWLSGGFDLIWSKILPAIGLRDTLNVRMEVAGNCSGSRFHGAFCDA